VNDFYDVFQEGFTAVVEHVGDKFESFFTAVIGVGDFLDLVFGLSAKGAEAFDFISIGSFGVEGGDVVVVVVVHGEDEIKIEKILGGEVPGFSFAWDTSFSEGLAHPTVGAFATMPVEGACGIDVDGILQSNPSDVVSENIFTGGGPADISQTDKEDAERLFFHSGWSVAGCDAILGENEWFGTKETKNFQI